ncbi:hypothetical protein VTN96DRAFT_6908 [Rasamsonia emersonii]
MPLDIRGKRQKLSGLADYTLWYGSAEELEFNLVVVGAKSREKVSHGDHQCQAYMGKSILLSRMRMQIDVLGMVHKARKAAGRTYTTVFGISTDSYTFNFFRMSEDSEGNTVLSTEALVFGQRPSEDREVISQIRKIFRFTANLTPDTRQLVSVSEGQGVSVIEQQYYDALEDE